MGKIVSKPEPGKFYLCSHRGGVRGGFKMRAAEFIIKKWPPFKKNVDFCHTELLFPDGISISSRAECGGVYPKRIKYSHPERWEFIEIDWPEWRIELTRARLGNELAKEYDYMGAIIGEGLRMGLQNDNKWYCSEICGYALCIPNYRLTPQELRDFAYRYFVKKEL